MQPATLLLISMLASMASWPAMAGEAVGVREIAIASSQRGENLNVVVWYPALTGGTKTLVGDSNLFKGEAASADAPLAPGRFPLILVSHGSGGRIQGMAWLATTLAQAGFIVAGPNHPGTTGGDSTPIDTTKLWERTDDLSTVATALASGAPWSTAIATEHIGVLGFSLGGTAAMEIVGARAERDAYARYCDTYVTMPDCVWFAGGRGYVDGKAVVSEKVDLHTIDKARFERSNRDSHIRAAVLVDPGLAQAFDEQSLKDIAIPLSFVNLGSPDRIPVGVISDRLARLVMKGSYAQVDGAVHFSFLPECKEGGAQFLESLGDTDRLCDDAGTKSRAAIHAELRHIITASFTRMLKGGM
jgi:predicted dienelactone hydrolase